MKNIYLLNVTTPKTETKDTTNYEAGIQSKILTGPQFEPAIQKIIEMVQTQTDAPISTWQWSCKPAPEHWAPPLEVLNTQDLIDGKVLFSQ